ncbi:helix-turn-helix transcriptional regulator [Nocardiopsis sp. HNM0947]|uniref:Helix-turn-helix transcriptional regulator n=1 Tax=Nocardiopsis coralli TaxID=2772213 RepID=A0ABR9P6T7_9ACTN|nr:Scr1 family TA system antitoxin-like transcriptional regulator [Nocardiopsis coralli]MBE2999537.1 helix-turn-helix transcriptional regulator [Nocardiopsis coralli]
MQEQEFGQFLAKERKRSGRTLRKLASLAGYSASTLSRWENSHSMPARTDVQKLDDSLNLNGRLTRRWEALTSPPELPPWMLDAGRLEEAASQVTYISPSLVPGLLQSPSYSTLIFQEGQPSWTQEEISRVAGLRCKRYELLRERNSPQITAVFPAVGVSMVPPRVRNEQSAHLLHLMGEGVRVHLIAPPRLLMGVTSPLLLARLRDGHRAASSDHQNGNVVFGASCGLERLFHIERLALADALPLEESQRLLKEMTT